MKLPTDIRALGLDMATKTGWASLDGGVVSCGRINFTPKPATKTRPKEHEGKRLLDFEKWLHGTLKALQPSVIYYEEAVTNKPNTARVLYGFRAVMMTRAAHFNIKVVGCHIGTVKKYATGKGNALKPAMVAEAKRLFPQLDILDDNVADALHVLRYGTETNL
jgi:Holliday junction resolvasome RuvABC endonuclease subunit